MYRSAAVFLLIFSVMVDAAGGDLLIEDVVLIDGTGRQPVSHVSILVRDDSIVEIKKGNFDQSVRKTAQVINGAQKYLIPGLMDVHVHLAGSMTVTEQGLREVEIDRQKGIRALHGYLYSGVTTIYDCGNLPDYIFALRDEERSGAITSPRIFAAGGIVTYPGSHGAGPGATTVDDWPEAIPLLDEHIKRQPDILKLTLEERGWGMRPMIPKLPLPLMEKIIEYYNDHGIRTTAHTAGELRARQAIFAGIDTLAHPVIVGPVSDTFAKLMGAKKVPMATTLTIGENYSRLAEHPEYLDQPMYQAIFSEAEIRELKVKTRKQYQDREWTWWMKLMTPVAQENLRKIHEAGGVLALGTDQTNGAAVHREMELLVAAGIAPSDVIRIATFNAARFLGKEDQLGTIEEGKLADMVLLNADPSEDINNAKDIHMVIKNGHVIDRDKLNLPVNE
ncbi:MAG: amidohydrolase family protein [Gammaproteobacteria bacterium]|nr:amidohydrolase family protein [Gammaproteobacteria bacterium]